MQVLTPVDSSETGNPFPFQERNSTDCFSSIIYYESAGNYEGIARLLWFTTTSTRNNCLISWFNIHCLPFSIFFSYFVVLVPFPANLLENKKKIKEAECEKLRISVSAFWRNRSGMKPTNLIKAVFNVSVGLIICWTKREIWYAHDLRV